MNQHKTPPLGSRVLTAVTAALLAFSAPHALAAKPKLVVNAKLVAKLKGAPLNKVVVSGKTVGIDPKSQLSIYDGSNHTLLYSMLTDNSGKFSIILPQREVAPCLVQVEAGGLKQPVKVKGNGECSAPVLCKIEQPASNTAVVAGAAVEFKATAKAGKKAELSYSWQLSGKALAGTDPNVSQTFSHPGRYRMVVNVNDGSGRSCSDDVMVSVSPAGTLPAKVSEPTQAAVGYAMPKSGNGENDYVVLPYDEYGMMGGSMINFPYNPLIPFNGLNAQVLKKTKPNAEGRKLPAFVDSTGVDLFYSAGSNSTDPAGGDSINSTSQNLFAGNEAGTNFNTETSSGFVPGAKETFYIADHDYNQAVIAKNELWDRSRQPWVEAANEPANADKNWALKGSLPDGKSIADTQNTAFQAPLALTYPLAKPDQGFRGNVDDGLNMRQMPGFADPYAKNDPQKFDFNADQNTFTAQMIPVSDVDDKGRTNPYPIMRIQAREGNEVKATTDAVLSAASETRCRECHSKGEIAADDQVWRTPVKESELQDLENPDKPGPATGKGSFPDGDTPQTGATSFTLNDIWPPAIHNTFQMVLGDDGKYYNHNAYDAKYSYTLQPEEMGTELDANGLRKDRVAESRWVNLKNPAETCPILPSSSNTDASLPHICHSDPAAGSDWKLQLRLKFKNGADYKPADRTIASWQDEEKAALWNTLLLHDYMVKYGISGKTYSSQLADMTEDKYAAGPGRTSSPMYFCSSHHGSPNRHEVGVKGRAIPTTRSDYSRAFHAFHGKMQVYKEDTTVDGITHKKGELIRDDRGHPKMYGGRGWDSQHNDNEGVPMKAAVDHATHTVTYTPATITPAAKKNDWAETEFPQDPNGTSLYPDGENIATEENCEKCHTGPTEKAYRDIHHARGLKCDACHGNMLAVGNVWANEKYDANWFGAGQYGEDKSDTITAADFRRPWLDEPNCGSCHVGDGNKGQSTGFDLFYSAGARKSAFDAADKTARSLDPEDARFAVIPVVEHRKELVVNPGPDGCLAKDSKVAGCENGTAADNFSEYKPFPVSQALYRKSPDVHGSGSNGALTCPTCHGGSHAIWPNPDPNANDNLTAKQLQGYDGNIAECSVCHLTDDFKDGKLATDGGSKNLGVAQGYRGDSKLVGPDSEHAYLAGPHGMHPVFDESWWKDAEGAIDNETGSHTSHGGWHNDFAKKPGPGGEDQCAACHGSDHKGTRLSKTLTDRIFEFDDFSVKDLKKGGIKKKRIAVKAGTIIGCNLCHSLDKSFKTGIAPKDNLPATPAPAMEAVQIGAYPGGGPGH
ncbi:MAG: PKD domain-containing protein [Methylococcaceae bacterium]|nr:PKD domain-containing protein [Desulfuromonas sp.]NJD06045.1 PKD domain-containing protein [Methylococcaceae bacterium]